MSVDELLDALDEMVDHSWNLPLSGGRCVLEAERVREIIDDIRLNLPAEVRQAKAIVADRAEIIKNARAEAASIVRTAQDKANVLVQQDTLTKAAQEKSAELLTQTNQQAKELRAAAAEFVDKLMHGCEESLVASLNELKQARQALRSNGRKGG